jgi:hypothetical protein
MLSVSCSAPDPQAPSPKMHATMPPGPLHPHRERHAGGDREVAADDRVRAEEPAAGCARWPRPPLPLHGPVARPEQLRHDEAGIEAARERRSDRAPLDRSWSCGPSAAQTPTATASSPDEKSWKPASGCRRAPPRTRESRASTRGARGGPSTRSEALVHEARELVEAPEPGARTLGDAGAGVIVERAEGNERREDRPCGDLDGDGALEPVVALKLVRAEVREDAVEVGDRDSGRMRQLDRAQVEATDALDRRNAAVHAPWQRRATRRTIVIRSTADARGASAASLSPQRRIMSAGAFSRASSVCSDATTTCAPSPGASASIVS